VPKHAIGSTGVENERVKKTGVTRLWSFRKKKKHEVFGEGAREHKTGEEQKGLGNGKQLGGDGGRGPGVHGGGGIGGGSARADRPETGSYKNAEIGKENLKEDPDEELGGKIPLPKVGGGKKKRAKKG